MRFANTIQKIQGLQAYHSGDKLNVEVDIVLDENTNLRDSHDLGESLQYVLESVPNGKFVVFKRYMSISALLRESQSIERLYTWIMPTTICQVICSRIRRKSLARMSCPLRYAFSFFCSALLSTYEANV